MLCLKCYHEFPPGSGRCPHCGAPDPAAAAPPVPAARPERGRCAWEEREKTGAFSALGETLQKSLFQPTEFFRNLPKTGREGAAIWYAVIVGTLSAAVAMMWQALTGFQHLLGETSLEIPHMTSGMMILGLAFVPLLVVVSVIVRSGILHLSLMILKGARNGYPATLKAAAYAASANTFSVFPFVGPPIGFVWRIVLTVTGLREMHGITTGRAFVAWLLPMFVIGFLAAIIVAVMTVAMMKVFPAVLGDIVNV